MTNTAADARFWDKAARKYARDPITDMPGYERTLERTRTLLRPMDSILEIGCGTGTTALRLASSVGRIQAEDVSGEMIAIAREKAAAGNVANVTFEVADADSPTGAEGSFDAVLAFNVLHLVGDRAAALARVKRLLRPGGLFVSKTPCLSEMSVLIRMAVPIMRMVGKAPSVAFFTGPELEQEIAAAGFSIEERARHGSGRKDPRIFFVARDGQPSRA